MVFQAWLDDRTTEESALYWQRFAVLREEEQWSMKAPDQDKDRSDSAESRVQKGRNTCKRSSCTGTEQAAKSFWYKEERISMSFSSKHEF